MDNNEIENILKNALPLDEVFAMSDDGSHFQVVAVGSLFDGMSRVKKQQAIYAPLNEYISNNRIHALSIKCYTPDEFKLERKLLGL